MSGWPRPHPSEGTSGGDARPRLVLASRNPGKLRELRALLADLPLEVLCLSDFHDLPEVDETGDTFLANALIKARSAARAAGVPALADDSGLEVDALGGRPGVWSARFAGPTATDEDNNRALLLALGQTPVALRTARFVSVVAFCLPDGRAVHTEGRLEGRIAFEPRGSHGFGYDPLFIVGPGDRRLAELEPFEKDLISHRGQAMRRMRPIIAGHSFDRAESRPL